MRFLSTISSRLDGKGRVSIPAPFRAVLAHDGFEGLFCVRALWEPAVEAGGNALIATLEYAQVTEVFCQLGERSLSAEQVAKRLADEVRAYQRSTGALGPHLADQWMLPLALAVWRSGQAASYTCSEVTQHTDTNAQTIAMGLPVRVQITPAAGAMRVEVSPLP